MLFVTETKTGERIEYRDTKRYLWLLALTVPLSPVLSVWLYFATGQHPLALTFAFFYAYIAIPVLDWIFGEDEHNPPHEILEQMAEDNYYRYLLYAAVPLFWLGFLVPAWLVGTQDIPLWAMLFLALSVGQINGTALTVGHELGHKQGRLDQWMAKFACAVSGYGHFCIEHNRGHHTHVATPEDCASSRFNESIYAFARRELPGALARGWANETKRLERRGLSFWHWRNDILQGYAIWLLAAVALVIAFGFHVIPFIIICSLSGWYALTQANYVEHYGLKRQRMENGRYEPCAPHHSWNTNHIVSNLMLFHLQRHSDHHANPLRPYQSLRNFDELPRLPSGYPGSFWLAGIPPLWFRIMNPKVMKWADGDMSRVNTG
ncbi:alkane 1-monooxygenase [Pseudahrensia aquimaris]|uniref:Alkane 1-monooxygenase n=1 Tax=Pseudahrensia aquimaris TaxID=744461 RepID=A0ABW3FGY3_9HYPH